MATVTRARSRFGRGAHDAAAADHLEQALRLIDQWMRSSPAKIAVLYRVAQEVARLRTHRICGTCGAPFAYPIPQQDYDLATDLAPPTACPDCAAGPDDQVLTCEHCAARFVFTKDAQDAYAMEGFKVPTACPPCGFLRGR